MKLSQKAHKLIRRIPILRALEKAAHEDAVENKRRRITFPGAPVYWEKRYAAGGDSGVGSYSKFAEFKADILNSFVVANNLETVIEFGCGDGNQLMLANYPRYIGFDVSPTAVSVCTNKFIGDKSKSFKLLENYESDTADLALSLDVIFHLISDDEFECHMRTLFTSATRFVIIYSSNDDDNDHNDPHVKHRKFTRWIDANVTGWSLGRHIVNKYPYTGNYKESSFSDFYIYEKTNSGGPRYDPRSAPLP